MFTSAFPLFHLTIDGVVVQANAPAEAIVATGASVVEAAEDGSRNRVTAALTRAVSNPSEVGIRLRGRSYRLVLHPAGDGHHMDAVLTPERPRADVGEGLEAFLARTPVCLAHLDAAGIVTFESNLACTLLGYSSVGDAFLSSDPELDRAVDALLAGGSSFSALPFTTEVRGMDVPLVGYGSAVRGAEGEVKGAVVIAVAPVTADGQIQMPRDEPDRGAFVSTVAHEVRNPLGVVNGFASMLSDELAEYAEDTGQPLPPPVEEFVETIQANARRALDILSDLSDLAKLEAGALTVRHEPVLLNDLVGRVGRAFVPEDGAELDLDTHLPPDELRVNGDPQRIEQILDTLMESAAKASGQATLTVTPCEECAEVILYADEWNAQGAAALAQAEGNAADRYRKGGRSFAIARGLAEAMGGTLASADDEDGGHTFTLTLPRGGS